MAYRYDSSRYRCDDYDRDERTERLYNEMKDRKQGFVYYNDSFVDKDEDVYGRQNSGDDSV